MLVVADDEDVAVDAGQLADHPVLLAVQVLEFVDEHVVPTRPHDIGHIGDSRHEVRGQNHERVVVDHVALTQEALVLLQPFDIVRMQGLASKAVGREANEQIAPPPRGCADAAECCSLVVLVSDSEPWLEFDARAEFSEELGAESVNSPALYSAGTFAEVPRQARGDLAGGLVSEREGTDP